MCRIDRIDRFLADWPDAAYGPAHIVLADANIEDGPIDLCIRLLETVLELREPHPDDVAFLERVDWYRDDARDELSATLDFLRAYRCIPETERIEPGDALCR